MYTVQYMYMYCTCTVNIQYMYCTCTVYYTCTVHVHVLYMYSTCTCTVYVQYIYKNCKKKTSFYMYSVHVQDLINRIQKHRASPTCV